eukprot:Lankesteria_metandrocarpae@DN501_c0_g1_i1.p1
MSTNSSTSAATAEQLRVRAALRKKRLISDSGSRMQRLGLSAEEAEKERVSIWENEDKATAATSAATVGSTENIFGTGAKSESIFAVLSSSSVRLAACIIAGAVGCMWDAMAIASGRRGGTTFSRMAGAFRIPSVLLFFLAEGITLVVGTTAQLLEAKDEVTAIVLLGIWFVPVLFTAFPRGIATVLALTLTFGIGRHVHASVAQPNRVIVFMDTIMKLATCAVALFNDAVFYFLAFVATIFLKGFLVK